MEEDLDEYIPLVEVRVPRVIQRDLICNHPGCGRRLGSDSSLRNHIRIEHDGIRPRTHPRTEQQLQRLAEQARRRRQAIPKIDARKLRAVSLSTPILELVCLAMMDVPIDIGSTTLEELEWVALYSVKQRPQSDGVAMACPALLPEQMASLSHMKPYTPVECFVGVARMAPSAADGRSSSFHLDRIHLFHHPVHYGCTPGDAIWTVLRNFACAVKKVAPRSLEIIADDLNGKVDHEGVALRMGAIWRLLQGP